MPTLKDFNLGINTENESTVNPVKQAIFDLLGEYDELKSQLSKLKGKEYIEAKRDLKKMLTEIRKVLESLYDSATDTEKFEIKFETFLSLTIDEFSKENFEKSTHIEEYNRIWGIAHEIFDVTQKHSKRVYFILESIHAILDSEEFDVTLDELAYYVNALTKVGDYTEFMCLATLPAVESHFKNKK